MADEVALAESWRERILAQHAGGLSGLQAAMDSWAQVFEQWKKL